MEDWDSPKRSRLFLAAALLVAACGFMLTNDRLDAPRLTENGLSADAAAGSLAAETAAPAPIPEALPPASGTASVAAPASSDELRDAVAGLPAAQDAAQAAARTAAFAAPAGRVPGAFAPAAAASAWAARRALGPSLDGQQALSISSAPASARPEGERAVDAVAPSQRSVSPRRRGSPEDGRALSPAERLLEARGRAAGGVSASDGLRLGTSPFARQTPAAAARRHWARPARPESLARLLGKGALKAPVGVKRPKLDPWSRPVPALGPDGAPLSVKPLGETEAESVTPPPACAKKGVHWDEQDSVRWLHDGALRGRLENGTWAWLQRDQNRWWLWPAPKEKPLLDHQDHWWLESRGMWFLLHDREAWGYQYLHQWGTEGFVARSGAQMIYSSDGSRLGLIVPGAGAVVYDARTGAELGRWTEAQLPRRRAAAAPQAPAF